VNERRDDGFDWRFGPFRLIRFATNWGSRFEVFRMLDVPGVGISVGRYTLQIAPKVLR